MAVVHVTVENFEEEVIKAESPVLIDFWASWCGPCKMLSPIVEELADELTNVKICKVNIDEQGALAEKFSVMSIPTLLVFKDGEVVNKAVGMKPKAKILEMLSL